MSLPRIDSSGVKEEKAKKLLQTDMIMPEEIEGRYYPRRRGIGRCGAADDEIHLLTACLCCFIIVELALIKLSPSPTSLLTCQKMDLVAGVRKEGSRLVIPVFFLRLIALGVYLLFPTVVAAASSNGPTSRTRLIAKTTWAIR